MEIKEISQPNAALKIEVIELSEKEKKSLTTNANYIRGESIAMSDTELNTQEKVCVDPYLTLGKMSVVLPLLAEAIGTRTSKIQEHIVNGDTAIHINIFERPSKYIQLSIWSNEPEILFFCVNNYDSPVDLVEIKTKNLGEISKFLGFFKRQYDR